EVIIGGVPVRVPAYFKGGGRADYETAALARLVDWFSFHPEGLLVDVGSSLSLYGLVALSTSVQAEVVAIDSDLVGLKCSRFLCSKAHAPERLDLVHGFAGTIMEPASTLDEILRDTDRVLADPAIPSDVDFIRYHNIPTTQTRRISLDGLWSAVPLLRPLIVKVDVEGAELDVLRGATHLLHRLRPTLLLSVHPQFGVDVAAIREFLALMGYAVDHFATDHEEHWLCTPLKQTIASKIPPALHS
ncbi:MAG TPA: FkbM family methyltransferase, partial [Opitutus sp.]|nr:FkbM family methyltransferase [Opitutus sp.]